MDSHYPDTTPWKYWCRIVLVSVGLKCFGKLAFGYYLVSRGYHLVSRGYYLALRRYYLVAYSMLLQFFSHSYYLVSHGFYSVTWVLLYPEWPHRQGCCLACWICKIDFRLSWDCTDLYYARVAQVVLSMRVGGATSQLDLPSLTPLSVAGCGRLQLEVPHWATSVDYCK